VPIAPNINIAGVIEEQNVENDITEDDIAGVIEEQNMENDTTKDAEDDSSSNSGNNEVFDGNDVDENPVSHSYQY
jgi:hypothetical protein